MKLNKKMLGLVLSGALMVSMTGCSSSEYDESTTQYLTEQGQETTNRYRESKEDYRNVLTGKEQKSYGYFL